MNDLESLLTDLDRLMCMASIQKEQLWCNPVCAKRVERSFSDLERVRQEVSRVPFLLGHGSTTKAASILRTAKKHRNRARNRLIRNDHEEEIYRLNMVKRIHDI